MGHVGEEVRLGPVRFPRMLHGVHYVGHIHEHDVEPHHLAVRYHTADAHLPVRLRAALPAAGQI